LLTAYIRPDLDSHSSNSFERMPEIINLGISATESRIKEIREKVREENLGWHKEALPPVVNPIIDSITFESASPSPLQRVPLFFIHQEVKSKPGDKIVPE
jgi:hypothetical protein